jgi:3(or 17)beta-hydroxysteroid dehydrogenase
LLRERGRARNWTPTQGYICAASAVMMTSNNWGGSAVGRLTGKVALVTGGASGIGAATCRLFAREGAAVLVADLPGSPGEAVADEITAAGGRALFQALDVRSEASWIAAIAAVEQAFGKLNILVNNAGVGSPMGTVEAQTLEGWRQVMAVNSDGVFLGVKHGVGALRRAGEAGSIVNLSSHVGIVGLASSAAYVASKGAVRLLTKSAALHCAQERLPIRVNSVHPGYTVTPMAVSTMAQSADYQARRRAVEATIPLGHMGEPEDIAHGILYLASDESRYVTGTELIIDGGLTAA